MFGDAAVMHFAVAGRMESAFSLKKVWKPYKANLGKLFCASILPEVLTGIVSNIIMGVFTVIFGSFAALGLSSYGYYGYYSPSGLEAIFRGGGIVLILFLMITAFVLVFFIVFGKMLKYRAVGYWAARHASEWADEDTDDVLTFVLPGEKKPTPAGFNPMAAGAAPAPAPAPATSSVPTSAPAPAPTPAPAPEATPAEPDWNAVATPADESGDNPAAENNQTE